MTARRRLVVVLGIVAAMVVAAVVTDASNPTTPALATGPRLSPGSAVTTWYCVEGTSNPGGRADEQIILGNVGTAPARARITVFAGTTTAPVRRDYLVPRGRVVRVHVADIAAVAEPGVLVEVRGGATAVEHEIRTATGSDTALGPCAREPSPSVSFAGTTAKGAELWLALFNPFPDDAIVDVRGITADGVRVPGGLQGVIVPRFSRVSVAVHDLIPRVDVVATEVTVRRGRAVAEQSLGLDGTDGRRGLAMTLGDTAASRWSFPLGLTGSGRQEQLVVANLSERDAHVTVRFALDAAAAIEPETLLLPATSVATVDLTRVPPDIGFSMTVESDRPIVAEAIGSSASPQAPAVQGIAADLGFTDRASEWALAPSRLATGSTDVVAIVATDHRRHQVQLVREDGAGARVVRRAMVPASGRLLIDVARLVPGINVALRIVADGPVVAERESSNPGLTRSHLVRG